MRVAGTAIICIAAAFGAAFLVGRAVKHPTPAKAATPRTTRVADTVRTTANSHVNAELVSQFTSVHASLKRRPKPRHRHHKPKPAPVITAAAAVSPPSTTTTPAPVTSAPVYSSPAPVQSAPAPTQSGPTHKKKSSGGSGTTTIGG